LAVLIVKITGFRGRIIWDKDKPDAQPRRRLDISRAYEEFGFKLKRNLGRGLKKTILCYKETFL